RLLAISSPPASPLSPWSSPPPQILFLPLSPILSPPSPILAPAPPPSPIHSLGYRAAMIRLRDEAASTSYLSSPHLLSTSRREDRPEVTLPPRKRLDIALGPRYEVGESSSAAAAARPAGGFRADYGFVATVDREIMHDPEREVGYGITDSWDEIVETLQGAPDMDEIYTRLDDEQTERQLSAGRLNMLFRDRRAHAYTRLLMEAEARMSREAWTRATDASDLVHGEVISLRTTVLGQIPETSESRTALQGQITALQGQVTALQAQTERQLLAGRLNMLLKDRRAHAYTRHLMETEVRMSREAWVRVTNASDLVHGEVMSLRTTVLGQMSEIRELQAADRKRQTVISELLRIDHRRSTEISELRTALQGQGLAGDPTHPELPEEAGGSA
nr:hypothetical protein [Tanacetum cinerariifolium]